MEREGLNAEQKKAVAHRDGPLLIIAGAGAGKTRVITHRIAALIESGVSPSAILAVTFTNKAAREMRDRVSALLRNTEHAHEPVFISTFHALGVRILKENATRIGLSRWFAIYDRDDSKSTIKKILKSFDYDPKQFEPKAILSIISREKGELNTVETYAQHGIKNFFREIVVRVWSEYDKTLRKDGALDFDDLLVETVRLFEKHPEVLAHYQKLFQYIHIDEYQDTNTVQYTLARMLAGDRHNICVVGDSDQTIYTWRGARAEHMFAFERDFPNTTTVILEENYRSTQTILSAANEVIKHNEDRKEKNLFTKRGDGEPIILYDAIDGSDEARFVVEKVSALSRASAPLEEIAVLYRANFQSRAFEEALLRAGIPYHLVGTKFFERKEVRDVLAYIRAALNPLDRPSIDRIINVPRRGLGAKTVEKVLAGETSTLPPKARKAVADFYALLGRIKEKLESDTLPRALRFLVQETMILEYYEKTDGGDERTENIEELVSLATKYANFSPAEALDRLLTDAALATDQDSLIEAGGGVRLMTVHAAKGLEFAHVFVVGLEEGLFPHTRHADTRQSDESRLEEERRLLYVALTRAKERLYLSHASYRTIFGNQEVCIPSSFLNDIPTDLFERIETPVAKTSYFSDIVDDAIEF